MMLVAVHMRWVLSRWHPTMMAATGAGADPVCPATAPVLLQPRFWWRPGIAGLWSWTAAGRSQVPVMVNFSHGPTAVRLAISGWMPACSAVT